MTPYCSEIWLRMFFHNPFNNKLTNDETLAVLQHLEQLWLNQVRRGTTNTSDISDEELNQIYETGFDAGLHEGTAKVADQQYKEGYMDGLQDTQSLINTFIEESRYAISANKSV